MALRSTYESDRANPKQDEQGLVTTDVVALSSHAKVPDLPDGKGRYIGVVSPKTMRITEGQILFTYDESQSGLMQSHTTFKNKRVVFAALNAKPLGRPVSAYAVSLGHYNPKDVSSDKDKTNTTSNLSAALVGMFSILNTGTHTFQPGQLIRAREPDPEEAAMMRATYKGAIYMVLEPANARSANVADSHISQQHEAIQEVAEMPLDDRRALANDLFKGHSKVVQAGNASGNELYRLVCEDMYNLYGDATSADPKVREGHVKDVYKYVALYKVMVRTKTQDADALLRIHGAIDRFLGMYLADRIERERKETVGFATSVGYPGKKFSLFFGARY